ncbi:MAG TPA: amidohydrolase family protein [Alphaproteobacteria bacterium]|jgi:predicted TIM-barrel fold metal-dependent hydrolase|nr:amidohydrolase family protein [Alphaproteobacteria bacterium]
MTHDTVHRTTQVQGHIHHDGCCGTSRRDFLRTTALITGGSLMSAAALMAPRTGGAATKAGGGTLAGQRIDTHFHIYPPALGKELGGRVAGTWSPQVALDQIDKNGIATGIFSVSSIPEEWWRRDKEWLRKTTRTINDYGAQLVRDKPKRFGQFAFLSMADVEGTLKEIEYAFDTLKADGVGIATSYGDKWPGDPMFAPIFDELNRRKAVVYFHPNAPFCCADINPPVGTSWIEYPHDTSRAVLSLLFNGSLAKHRDIKFLFSHGGGTIPMLAGRIASSTTRVKNLKEVAPEGVEAEFKRLHYDTANATSAPTIAALTKLIPLERIVYGSDYPYYSEEENVHGLETVGLSKAQLTAIYRDNALKLVPRLKA